MTIQSPSRLGGLLLACTLAALPGAVSADYRARGLSPIGGLDIAKTAVRHQERVRLSWNIIYPADLAEVAEVTPRGDFKTLRDVDISVHVIGMEYSSFSHDNGHGNNGDGVDVTNPGKGGGGPNGRTDVSEPLDDELHTNGNLKEIQHELDATLWIAVEGAWTKLFHGGASELAGESVYEASRLPEGTTVHVAAQGESKNGTHDIVSTATDSPSLVVLRDGDRVPASSAWGGPDAIEGFLNAYADNGTVRLGPTQLIYLFDLDASPGRRNFGLRDLGVLVTLTPNEERRVTASRSFSQ